MEYRFYYSLHGVRRPFSTIEKSNNVSEDAAKRVDQKKQSILCYV